MATIDVDDWDSIPEYLVHYWLKVAEVLPRYYASKTGSDPLADQPPDTIATDNGWNRIVCLLDTVYGKITTNFWIGSQRPQHMDRVWIIVKFTMIENASRESPKNLLQTNDDDLAQRMHIALAEAADREPAKAVLEKLQHWREFDLWVMHAENPETLCPLFSTQM